MMMLMLGILIGVAVTLVVVVVWALTDRSWDDEVFPEVCPQPGCIRDYAHPGPHQAD